MTEQTTTWEKSIRFLLGSREVLKQLQQQRPYRPFSEETIDFLDLLYQKLREENRIIQAADLAAFGFWCRKGNLRHSKEQYEQQWKGRVRIGRGIAFHIVPSNIPVLFAFSMAASLLAGNPVILRLPEKETLQEQVILTVLRQSMEERPEWKNRIVIVRYGHEKNVTDALSELCRVRVIWGGDHSIQEIRQSVLAPGKSELAFADRRSAAIFRASDILQKEDLTDVVRGFYNDTYLNDQNACSSPSLIYWIGSEEQVKSAREKFWKAVSGYVQSHYELGAHLAVQKWEQAMYIAAIREQVQIEKYGNDIVLVRLPELTHDIWSLTVPGGFFLEGSGENLKGLYSALTEKCQTITCMEEMDRRKLAIEFLDAGVAGVDRIVPVGHALDFSLVWDGIDLIAQMSREIDVS